MASDQAMALVCAWGVKFQQISAGADGFSHGFWHLEGPDESDLLRVNVYVHHIISAGGVLSGMVQSMLENELRVNHILASTDREPEKLWAPATIDEELGGYSFQYLDVVGAGRFLVVARQHIVDISGMSSTAALKTIAQQLLQHTKTNKTAVPTIKNGPLTTSRSSGLMKITNTSKVVVQKINTRFSFAFELHEPAAAGGASNDGKTLLFDKFTLKEGGRIVEFDFITRKLGNYTVKVHLMDAQSMVSVSKEVVIEVSA